MKTGCPKRLAKWLDPGLRKSTREKAGLSVVEMAGRLKIQPAKLRAWERGSVPLASAFLPLADLLESLEERK